MKYSEESGHRYIDFSREQDVDTGGCDARAFFEEIIAQADEITCARQSVVAFRKVFRDGADYGVWAGSNHDFYYFLSSDEPSFVFVVFEDGSNVKLESDFLTKAQFQDMLTEYQ